MEKASGILEIKKMSNLIRQFLECSLVNCNEVTPTQILVIDFLAEHATEDVYQKDLEAAFQVRRSTITGVLQGMEKRSLIARQAVPTDARLKKITLTPEGWQLHRQLVTVLLEMEEIAIKDICQKDMDLFLCVNAKIKQNLLQAMEDEKGD